MRLLVVQSRLLVKKSFLSHRFLVRVVMVVFDQVLLVCVVELVHVVVDCAVVLVVAMVVDCQHIDRVHYRT